MPATTPAVSACSGWEGLAAQGAVLVLLVARPPRRGMRALDRAARGTQRGGDGARRRRAGARDQRRGTTVRRHGTRAGRGRRASRPSPGADGSRIRSSRWRSRSCWRRWAPRCSLLADPPLPAALVASPGRQRWSAIVVLFVWLAPVVLDPLFNRYTELPPGRARSDVEELARRAGIDVGDVLVVDASRRTTARQRLRRSASATPSAWSSTTRCWSASPRAGARSWWPTSWGT